MRWERYAFNLILHLMKFLRLSQAGDIHIWDRVSAVLLHHIRAQEVGGDLTCIAWNPAAEDPFMFGTGSHDGAVRIWSSPSRAQDKNNPSQPHNNGAPGLVEISSSFGSDIEYHRTDSPIPHLDSDSQQTHGAENEGGSSRERTIAFANDT
jgi:WD40 repeat protein